MKTNKLGLTVQVWYGARENDSWPTVIRLETSDGRAFVMPGLDCPLNKPDDVKLFNDYEEMNLYVIEARQQFKLMGRRS